MKISSPWLIEVLNKFRFLFIAIAMIFLLILIFIIPRVKATDPFIWNGGGADDNLSTAANWVGGVAPTGVSGDELVFTGSTRLTPNNDISGGTFTSITFSADGFTMTGNAFTLDGGAAAISNTTGTNVIKNAITFSVAAPTAAVAASTGLVLGGAIDNGGLAFTFDAGSSASTTLSGVISGTGALIKTSSGTTTITGANLFSGGLTIKQGTVVAGRSNATTVSGVAGPSGNAITLGASDGGAASLLANSFTVSNAINLGSGAVGTTTIGNNGGTTSGSFGGAISLNGNNLTIARSGTTGVTTIYGGITGIGNVIFRNSGSTSTLTISTAPINNVGTITNLGSSYGAVTISGGIGANVTSIKESSETSALTINTTALTVNSSGTTLINSTEKLFTMSGGTTGTGNLIINNNGPTSSGILIGASAVNHTGTITNSGLGATTTIAGIIGTNVTGVIQNSSTSDLSLSGANTFTGGLNIKNGNAFIGVSNVGSTSGGAGPSTIPITLGASDGGPSGLLVRSTFTISNAINITAGSVGTTTIGTDTNSSPIFSGAIALNGNNLTIYKAGTTGGLTISGGITGTGNVTFRNGGSSSTMTVNTASINNVGTITNLGSGSGALTISGGIGANVTSIKESSETSALTISTTVLTVNSSGTTLINSAGTAILTVSGGITGTGDLILNNNSSTAAGITLSTTAINHTGAITNSGSGAGSVTISAAIGSNVTTMRYAASGGGALLLSNSNTFGTFRDNDGTIAHTIQFGAGTTQTVGTWNVSGAIGKLVTLQSTEGGSPWNLTSATAGNQASDYLILSDSSAAGTSVWFAGPHSTNGSGNSGWAFTGAPYRLFFSTGPTFTNYGSTMSPVVVRVVDSFDNTVATATHLITLAIIKNPNNGILSGTLSKAAGSGSATFSDLSIDKSGHGYTLSASASGLTTTISDSFDITNPGQGGGGGSNPAPSPAPPFQPADGPVSTPPVTPVSNAELQAMIDSLIKQLLELQARVANLPSGIILSQISQSLTIGARGDDVRLLQIFLIGRSIGPAVRNLQEVGATSYFGSLTRAALAEFQKSVGISPAVGYFGSVTKAYLRSIGY